MGNSPHHQLILIFFHPPSWYCLDSLGWHRCNFQWSVFNKDNFIFYFVLLEAYCLFTKVKHIHDRILFKCLSHDVTLNMIRNCWRWKSTTAMENSQVFPAQVHTSEPLFPRQEEVWLSIRFTTIRFLVYSYNKSCSLSINLIGLLGNDDVLILSRCWALEEHTDWCRCPKCVWGVRRPPPSNHIGSGRNADTAQLPNI